MKRTTKKRSLRHHSEAFEASSSLALRDPGVLESPALYFEPAENPMSDGAKIAIGVAVLAALGIGAYFIFKPKAAAASATGTVAGLPRSAVPWPYSGVGQAPGTIAGAWMGGGVPGTRTLHPYSEIPNPGLHVPPDPQKPYVPTGPHDLAGVGRSGASHAQGPQYRPTNVNTGKVDPHGPAHIDDPREHQPPPPPPPQ